MKFIQQAQHQTGLSYTSQAQPLESQAKVQAPVQAQGEVSSQHQPPQLVWAQSQAQAQAQPQAQGQPQVAVDQAVDQAPAHSPAPFPVLLPQRRQLSVVFRTPGHRSLC